ncbi:MAG TPA: hypothetical protein VNG51_15510 [Ktedonobacteraceae bacterium]|nr:hypothetical protein [Ktedonobacteraceae bacterium]
MKHLKQFAFPCVLIVAMAIMQFGMGVASAAAIPTANCGQWNIALSPNVATSNVLTAVAAVSTTNVWAVGYSEGTKLKPEPLIENWNGKTWNVVTNPSFTSGGALYGITVVSATDIWAVGTEYKTHLPNGKGLTEHWNGTQWSVIGNPGHSGSGSVFYGVTAISSTNVWAVGEYYANITKTKFYTFSEQWNGTKWSIVTTPAPKVSAFTGVSAVTSGDMWAVGYSGGGKPNVSTLTQHWNGATWNIVGSPNVGAISRLNGVAAVTTGNVWAVGESGGTGAQNALIENWNGATWSVSSNPGSTNGTILNGVTALSASDVWAVGQTTSSGVTQTFTEQWNGTQWSIVSSPNVGTLNNELNGVGGVAGSTYVWAASTSATSKGSNTLVESYC